MSGCVGTVSVVLRSSKDEVGRSGQAASFVAASTVPRTFQRTLMPRSSVDQGIVTGTSFSVEYMLAAAISDGIEALSERVAERLGLTERSARRAATLGNALVAGAGLAMQSAFPRRPGERLVRGLIRVAGWQLARTGVAGVAVAGLESTLSAIDRRTRHDYRLRELPVAVPAGAAVATAADYVRGKRNGRPTVSIAGEEWHPPPMLRSAVIGAGVWVGLASFAAVERRLAHEFSRGIAATIPGRLAEWRLAGHAAALGALGGGMYAALQRLRVRVEEGATKIEPGLEEPPQSTFTSGGPGSLVPYESLTREGWRHVHAFVRPDWIEQVMGEPARAHPIRVYVGLDSAPTEADRVRLALDEMDRTGAFDRRYLLLVSPTGTGYVNYAAVEAAEYFARGDIATVTMQYSKRPSALSLDRIDEGCRQNRMLWLQIHRRLYARPPEKRPTVLLFGESLGAHTSQDAFAHEGTDGLQLLGIDRALWLGTPYGSKWKDQVLGRSRPDVDRSLILTLSSADDWARLDPDRLEQARYVLLTHGDDAVAYFGLDLLVSAPSWLADDRPSAVPPSMRWVPVPVFLQTFMDMKNAMQRVPGEFGSRGHDYRADIARSVRAAYGFEVSDEQLTRVEDALRWYEKFRADYLEQHRLAARLGSLS